MPTEKTGNYQTSLKGGGYPHFGKTPNYFRFFLMKASLKYPINKQNKLKESCVFNDHICNLQSTVYFSNF